MGLEAEDFRRYPRLTTGTRRALVQWPDDLQWAWQTLSLGELRATVHPDNTASVRMLESVGFLLADDRYDDDPDTLLYISPYPGA